MSGNTYKNHIVVADKYIKIVKRRLKEKNFCGLEELLNVAEENLCAAKELNPAEKEISRYFNSLFNLRAKLTKLDK